MALNACVFKRCCFCGISYHVLDLQEHQSVCNRNVYPCEACGEQVPMSGFAPHIASCDGPGSKPAPVAAAATAIAVPHRPGGSGAPHDETKSLALRALLRRAVGAEVGDGGSCGGSKLASQSARWQEGATDTPCQTASRCLHCDRVVGPSHICDATQGRCLHCGDLVDVRLADLHRVRCLRRHRNFQAKLVERSAAAEKHSRYHQGHRPARQPAYSDGLQELLETYAPPIGPSLLEQQRIDGALRSERAIVDLAQGPTAADRRVLTSQWLDGVQTEGRQAAEEGARTRMEGREASSPAAGFRPNAPPQELVEQLMFDGLSAEERATLRRCTLCRGVVEQARFAEHLDCCPANVRSCEFCHAGVPVSELEDHLLSCPHNRRACYICGQPVRVCEMPEHLTRCGRDGKVITMFHGTSLECARAIMTRGFLSSPSGLLGAGVYLSRDAQKAANYGPVIVEARVRIGRVALISRKGHPLQKSWAAHGFDAAWVPPNTRVGASVLEEHCVADPRRIAPVKMVSAPARGL